MGGTTLPGEAFLRENLPGFAALDPAEPLRLPIEARDGGIYQGFLLTWMYLAALKRSRAKGMPPVWMLALMVLFVAAMGFDGVNAFLYDLNALSGLNVPYLYLPQLELRLITGLLCGIAFAGILLPIVNQFLWRANDPRPLFENWKQFGGALAVLAVFALVNISEIGIFYYPVAILSSASVLILLTLINSVFILSFSGRYAIAATWRETLNPLAIGMLLTLIELGAMSLMRYAVLGTATLP